MNRKDRRANKTPMTEQVYSMKRSQIDNAVKTAYLKGYKEGALTNVNAGVDTVIALILGMPVKVLKEVYGWERKELEQFADNLCTEFSVFSEGKMTRENYTEYLKQAIDMEFETYEDNKSEAV